MPRNERTKAAKERLRLRRKERIRKKENRKPATRARRIIAFKAIVCVFVVALFFALALFVGDDEYKATVIGWAPFFAVILAIVCALLYAALLRNGVTFAEESIFTDCQRGDDVRFEVAFKNHTPLFAFRVEAYFYISDLFGNIAHESMTTMALAPFERAEMGFETTFDHIGTYTAGLDRIVVCDFLRLFTFTIRNERRHTVNVTPRLQVLDDVQFSQDAMLETTKAAKSILSDSMDYSHVRQYEPGDPLKTIHWKLSARTGEFQTRLYEVYTNPGVGIILDFYAPADEALTLMGMFDAVVESGFSLANHAAERGMDTELFFCNKRDEDRRVDSWGSDEMPALIDEMPQMSNLESDKHKAVQILRDQVASQYGQNNIVVCSADMDPELISAVIEAKIRLRAPMFIAVVPPELDGRALDKYCSNLSRLDAVDIPYKVIARSDDLLEVI